MLDLAAIRARAAQRAQAEQAANPANRLIPGVSVSKLATLATPAGDAEKAEPQAERAEPLPPRSANPLMTPQQLDECHSCGWDDAELATFQVRAARFIRLGITEADAEHLAERLTLRDREGDDRRLCLECTWLGATGRCLAAATGRRPGADRWLEPAQTLLHQCDAFGLRKGLV